MLNWKPSHQKQESQTCLVQGYSEFVLQPAAWEVPAARDQFNRRPLER
jgi:hypothetical protein